MTILAQDTMIEPTTAGASSIPETPDRWTAATLAAALRARGVSLTSLVFPNSARLAYAYSAGTLKLAPSFRKAPDSVVDDLAVVLTTPASRQSRGARFLVDSWPVLQAKSHVIEFASAMAPPARPVRCDGSPAQQAALAASYAQLNAAHFSGRLPADMPLRWSRRLTRSAGIFSALGGGEVRSAGGIVFNLALCLPANASVFRDTLLHEMAHAEAWLTDGDRGHGWPWQRIARRVGANAALCGRTRLPARPIPGLPLLDVPAVLDR